MSTVMAALAMLLVTFLPFGEPVLASDVHRFPWSYSECFRRRCVSKMHSEYVEMNPWKFSEEWRIDAKAMYLCWQYLYTGKHDPSNLFNLGQLRELIGPLNYQLGRMPDYLPEYRFFDQPK